jgi:hypothetical protein
MHTNLMKFKYPIIAAVGFAIGWVGSIIIENRQPKMIYDHPTTVEAFCNSQDSQAKMHPDCKK